ncbi:MAG: hypothetical protein ACKVHO_11415 [Verrucomicrobiia bacterium]|jgi:hypothetical protein
MADDLGYADAGCYGGKTIAAPNIDRASTRLEFTLQRAKPERLEQVRARTLKCELQRWRTVQGVKSDSRMAYTSSPSMIFLISRAKLNTADIPITIGAAAIGPISRNLTTTILALARAPTTRNSIFYI